MHQPRKWWIGLPVLGILVYFAIDGLTPEIEADLKFRLAERLSIDPAKITVAGRDVAISGAPPEALAALRGEPGLRKAAVAGGPQSPAAAPPPRTPGTPPPAPPPPRDPYVFSASRGDALIALDGKLPSEELRRKALELAARAGAGLAVSDGAKIDAAAPAGDYSKALGVALDALAALSQGKVTLADNRLSVEGRGGVNVTAEGLRRDIGKFLPQGFELAGVQVTPGPASPFVFEAARDGAKVTLAGYAPDEATRKRLVDGARRRFFDAAVDDRLIVAGGAPQNFADAAEAGLAALARLADGKLAMSDANLTLAGAARYDGARAAIESALAERLPRSFKSDARLTARTIGSTLDAAGCRAALSELAKTPILFDAGDAAISDDSNPLLDALTATILRCQGAPIEVAGHIDRQGVAELDRERSKRRAALVVERFVKAGADSFRVWAAGYGAEKPVAPDDSEENRARNRRIEFNVK